MSRLNNIRAYKERQDVLKANAELEKENKTQALIKQIQALRPRIDELLQTANACVENGIEINAYRKQHYGDMDSYEKGTFVTNSISHKLGFVYNWTAGLYDGEGDKFSLMGINAGGACGNLSFRTDGINVFSVEENNIRKTSSPLINHMESFLNNFDAFEASFYSYVDQIVENVQPVEPIKKDDDELSKIDAERLNVLLYNAVARLEEHGCNIAQLKTIIGITEQEYNVVMGMSASLEQKIAEASNQFVKKQDKVPHDKQMANNKKDRGR